MPVRLSFGRPLVAGNEADHPGDQVAGAALHRRVVDQVKGDAEAEKRADDLVARSVVDPGQRRVLIECRCWLPRSRCRRRTVSIGRERAARKAIIAGDVDQMLEAGEGALYVPQRVGGLRHFVMERFGGEVSARSTSAESPQRVYPTIWSLVDEA